MSLLRELRTRLTRYGYLARLHRPIGILLLLWPALWALWIAGNGRPDPKIVLIFILGVALMVFWRKLPKRQSGAWRLSCGTYPRAAAGHRADQALGSADGVCGIGAVQFSAGAVA